MVVRAGCHPPSSRRGSIFKAETYGITEFEACLFDRWGKLFYSWKDKDGGWDGKYNGELVQEDVYVWKAQLTNVLTDVHKYVGTVTVVR